MGWEAVRKELQAMAEPDYRAFASGLIPGGTPMLGVRLPALRGLAKRIARGDWRVLFRAEKGKCFEETLLRGMVIGYAKAGVMSCSLIRRHSSRRLATGPPATASATP